MCGGGKEQATSARVETTLDRELRRPPRAAFVLLIGAYLLGAQVALWFVDGTDQIALIWPPAG